MLNLLLSITQYLIPVLLLAIPVLLFFDISPKRRKKTAPAAIPLEQPAPEPDIRELEKKLNRLLENNSSAARIDNLQKELQTSKSNTVAAYIKLNKKDLKGFHLFQLIFSLIKNRAEDAKIIKILRHYLPSCATSHLYAMLHSFKVFLNISREDGRQKELLRDLNHNRVRTTLLYLEGKLNQTLNQVSGTPPAMQQPLIDRAVVYGWSSPPFRSFTTTKLPKRFCASPICWRRNCLNIGIPFLQTAPFRPTSLCRGVPPTPVPNSPFPNSPAPVYIHTFFLKFCKFYLFLSILCVIVPTLKENYVEL